VCIIWNNKNVSETIDARCKHEDYHVKKLQNGDIWARSHRAYENALFIRLFDLHSRTAEGISLSSTTNVKFTV